MKQLLIPIAIAAGCLLPIQGALLARLGPLLNHPVQATLISYIAGFLVCIAFLSVINVPYPGFNQLYAINWYLYTAGAFGMVFVTGMLYLMPQIGVANMLVAAIIGQLVGSLLIDHFGLFGGLSIPISPSRIFGVLLLLAGLFFIQR